MDYKLHAGDCAVVLSQMEPKSVDLVFGSPPYEDARTYGMQFGEKGEAWVDWMIPIIKKACQVSKGLVLVNAAGKVRNWRYSPIMEMLTTDLYRHHKIVCGPSPYAWVKSSGIPGSGSKHYHRRNWEPVYSFCYQDRLPLAWSDNLAFGAEPKYKSGGSMSNRKKNGDRVNSDKGYVRPAVANPGNVIFTKVGGGHLGSKASHDNEAPMPESLAERFVCWYCPPGGTVLDPWCGSGTTLAVAAKHGRNAIGIDIRPEQCRRAEIRVRRFLGLSCDNESLQFENDPE